MSSETKSASQPLDLSRWRGLPMKLIIIGAVLSIIGLIVNREEFAYSWLMAFMLFLSLCCGALFLVIAHHLFDAGWSVPIRRFCEHIATMLFPTIAILFLPIVSLAKTIYPWMRDAHPKLDHALQAKQPLFSMPGFYISAIICFGLWWFLTNRLRYWSLVQDKTGGSLPTYRMRFYAAIGIIIFAT